MQFLLAHTRWTFYLEGDKNKRVSGGGADTWLGWGISALCDLTNVDSVKEIKKKQQLKDGLSANLEI